jgi:undecaprenyl-diphosphatase
MKKQWWFVLITLFIISFFRDKQVLNFFINYRIESLNRIISLFTSWYTLIGLAVILTIIISKKKFIIPLWISGFIGFIASNFLKFLFTRARPNLSSLIPVYTNSFPSSHATVVFAILPLLNKKFKKFWIVFSILVVLSRLYVGVHYPSDLLGGVLLGLIIGYSVKKYYKSNQ